MVLGLKTKNRKGPSVQVDYVIHIQEIKPWPPSQSLRSLRSALIQWEHGDRNSGSTSPVIPSLGSGSGVGDGKIEFNESFKLSVTLLRELSIKSGEGDTFQKNCLEFNLYEPRRDKTVKGQLLGTAIVDLAEYGVVKESLTISAPMNCKRTFRNTAQPMLFLKIQTVEKNRRDKLLREESVSALMNEEYAEEAEVASLTDDDVSSHSSVAVSSTLESNGGSPPQKDNKSEAMKGTPDEAKYQPVLASKQKLAESDVKKPMTELHGSLKGSSRCSSSTDLSSDSENPENVHTASNFHEPSLTLIQEKIAPHSEGIDDESNINTRSNEHCNLAHNIHKKVPNGASEMRGNPVESTKESVSNGSLAEIAYFNTPQVDDKLSFPKSIESRAYDVDDEKAWSPSINGIHESPNANVIENGSADEKSRRNHQESGEERQFLEESRHSIEDEPLGIFSQDETWKKISLGNDAFSVSKENQYGNSLSTPILKHVKSVRSLTDSGRSNGSLRSNQFVEITKDDIVPKDARNGTRSSISSERKYADSKVQQLENRIKMLEGELREAAAIEVSLYSVVAEHGSSLNKVHAPARRLSRLYLHACKENSKSRRASAARSAVSGLVLVTKACGNDVPRLTFWLSNSVVLRAIIHQAFEEQQLPLSAGPFVKTAGVGKGNNEKSSLLKWKESSSSNETRRFLREGFDNWEDPRTFISALEKIEAWIFSRIVESVWWQTLTPYMQSAAAKSIIRVTSSASSKLYQRTSSSCDQEQVNFSLELWKNAFRESCERICPVRAGGHECGCLPVLSRLIMEQSVARLDVAMFNAILRESADEIPTDPVSDPISDAKVLPIPAGKASFGAGAQLKNAIGNWSRWLTDLFGIDDDELLEARHEDEPDDDSEKKEVDTSFKPFHLLNALSDLMMLPKDLLLSRSIRKEVCPTFGAPLLRKILNNFVPDEFCPDPIPKVVLEALESEDPFETRGDSVVDVPCAAAPIVYLPPSASLLANVLGNNGSQSMLSRSGSSVLRKSYTSDDELDELNSPMISIIDTSQAAPTPSKPSWTSNGNGTRNSVRYQLLREVWMDGE